MESPTTSDEKLLRIINEHWMSFLKPTLVYLFLIVVTILIFFIEELIGRDIQWFGDISFVGMLIMLFGFHHWYFHQIMSVYSNNIVVTSKRIMLFRESPFVRDEIREIPIDMLRAVKARKTGIFGTVLNYGILWFDTGSTTKFDSGVGNIPQPESVAMEIMDLMEKPQQ